MFELRRVRVRLLPPSPPFQEPVKPKLTPEEAKAAAAELVRKAKERRLAEEAETEALRERERIR